MGFTRVCKSANKYVVLGIFAIREMDDCTYSMYLEKSLLHKIVVLFCLLQTKSFNNYNHISF